MSMLTPEAAQAAAKEALAHVEQEMYGSSKDGWAIYNDESNSSQFGPFTKDEATLFLLRAVASGQFNLFAVNKRDLPRFFNS